MHRLVVVGLAGDYCVKARALGGIRLGSEVHVPIALTRSVELSTEDGERAVTELVAAGVDVSATR